jgi:hypothetical protein
MRKQCVRFTVVSTTIVLAFLLACGGGEKKAEQMVKPSDFLAQSFDKGKIERTGEIRTFVGDSLWEYIDGDAEIYHQYGFVDVSTGDYKLGNLEFVADIYRFNNSINAYGLYTAVRPINPDTVAYGIQGFISETMLTFVKGDYLVRLIAFETSDEVTNALNVMASEIAPMIPGDSVRPSDFALLPTENVIPATDKYFSSSYQGQAFLTDVYVQSYDLDGDTVALFFSLDSAGAKYLQWKDAAEPMTPPPAGLDDLAYTNDQVFATNTYYGPLVAGLKDSYLAGMEDYSLGHAEFLSDWINTLGM